MKKMSYVNWIQAVQIINKQNDCLESSCTWDCELVLFFTGVLPGSTRLLSSKEWLYIAWMWLAIIICKKYTKDKISVLVCREKEKKEQTQANGVWKNSWPWIQAVHLSAFYSSTPPLSSSYLTTAQLLARLYRFLTCWMKNEKRRTKTACSAS